MRNSSIIQVQVRSKDINNSTMKVKNNDNTTFQLNLYDSKLNTSFNNS